MRISILGLPGSGKTYLAERISRKLSIPHIHLDRFWFEANGLDIYKNGSAADRELVRASVREKTLAAIAADSWVADGIYLHIQPEIAERADTIIFLDIPFWRRLPNHFKRAFRPEGRHEELSWWHEVTFVFEMIRREFHTKPKLKKFIDENLNKVVVLKSRKEIDAYLSDLK